jgi:hypothetical protein
MLLPARTDKVTVQRILKVNHAGERAAINIYGAQSAVAQRFFPGILPRRCAWMKFRMTGFSEMPCRRVAPGPAKS